MKGKDWAVIGIVGLIAYGAYKLTKDGISFNINNILPDIFKPKADVLSFGESQEATKGFIEKVSNVPSESLDYATDFDTPADAPTIAQAELGEEGVIAVRGFRALNEGIIQTPTVSNTFSQLLAGNYTNSIETKETEKSPSSFKYIPRIDPVTMRDLGGYWEGIPTTQDQFIKQNWNLPPDAYVAPDGSFFSVGGNYTYLDERQGDTIQNYLTAMGVN